MMYIAGEGGVSILIEAWRQLLNKKKVHVVIDKRKNKTLSQSCGLIPFKYLKYGICHLSHFFRLNPEEYI